MPEKVTLEFPDDLLARVRMVADHTHRSLEEVLLDWVRHAGAEPVMELLPDAEVLAVCDLELTPAQQEEVSDLLERNREGELGPPERSRLEELMRLYRTALVRKAQALKVAASRGLRSRLS
jgi:hypothetical protein